MNLNFSALKFSSILEIDPPFSDNETSDKTHSE